MNHDERRALGFITLLLALAAVARLGGRPPEPDLSALAVVDTEALAEASRQELARAERRRQGMAAGERLDPNRADAGELERLPGVGPGIAARIVEERTSRGPFATTGDLLRVPGIGPARLDRLAPHLDLPPGPAAGPAAHGLPPPGFGPAAAAPASTVDLNRASAGELARLPGIGPALAGRIVAWRDSAGPFGAVDELERVPGIGRTRLAALRPWLRVSR
jgi:competence ComEA-like helix-hairpin-helix protein